MVINNDYFITEKDFEWITYCIIFKYYFKIEFEWLNLGKIICTFRKWKLATGRSIRISRGVVIGQHRDHRNKNKTGSGR